MYSPLKFQQRALSITAVCRMGHWLPEKKPFKYKLMEKSWRYCLSLPFLLTSQMFHFLVGHATGFLAPARLGEQSTTYSQSRSALSTGASRFQANMKCSPCKQRFYFKIKNIPPEACIQVAQWVLTSLL